MVLLPLTPTAGLGATPVPRAACSAVLGSLQPYVRQHLATIGTDVAEATITVPPGHQWLIEAREQGNDAIVEVRDGTDQVLAQADHPERRTGTRRILIPAGDRGSLHLRVAGKEHPGVTGTVEIAVFDFAKLSVVPACVRPLQSLAAADADYAIAQQISRGRLTTAAQSARDAYLRAAEEYLAAETELDHPADAALRGEAALALAGLQYFDLQDWRKSAQWAHIAEGLFDRRDAYRLARAQALGAAAWIEVAMDTGPPRTAADSDSDPKVLLAKARSRLYQLFSFHRRRQGGTTRHCRSTTSGWPTTMKGDFGSASPRCARRADYSAIWVKHRDRRSLRKIGRCATGASGIYRKRSAPSIGRSKR